MDKFEQFKKFHNHDVVKNVDEIVPYLKSEKPAIIDVGSNIGLFTNEIIKKTQYDCIHLFEPSKELSRYAANLLKKYNNIFHNSVGLSNKDEEAILYKCPTGNIGWNTILKKDPYQKDSFVNNMVKEEVRCITLDNYIKNTELDKIDLIKIDVEGYEAKVIEGALGSLAKFKPVLYVEVGWGNRHPEWDENKLVYDKLFEFGYKAVNDDEFGKTANTKDVVFVCE